MTNTFRYFLISILFVFSQSCSSQEKEEVRVTIDLETTLVSEFQGWGVSLAWWAKIAGEHLTDEELLVIADKLLKEAKYNYFRYDIGGGDDPSHNHMREGGDIEGYPQLGNDRQQIRMLKAIAELAQNHDRPVHFEAISYSPPYEMTKSGCTAGNADGTDNLREDRYDEFAMYIAGAVHYLNTKILQEYSQNGRQLKIEKLAPYNEPQSNWWKLKGNQEGCPFSTENQIRLLPIVRKALDSLQLKDVKIVVNEANSLEEAVEAAAYYERKKVLELVDEYAVHTYHGLKYRKAMKEMAEAQNKTLVVSETGPLDVKGSKDYIAALMAERIVQDINQLNCAIWFDWQAYSTSDNWSLYREEALKNHLTTQEVSRQLYFRQQFTHYVTPGSQIIKNSSEANVLTALTDKSLSIVVTNTDSEETISYMIDLPKGFENTAKALNQTNGANLNFSSNFEYDLTKGQLIFDAPALSTTSFEIRKNHKAE